MANLSIKTGTISRSMLVGNPSYVPPSFESIATAVGTGSSGSIVFSSIPSTYKHLQIRYISKDTSVADGTLNPVLTFNSDTGNNYSYHELRGNGTSPDANKSGSATGIIIFSSSLREASTTNAMGVAVIDIFDYASTTKNKTINYVCGMNKNQTSADDRVSTGSGSWVNTSAITSLRIQAGVANFTTTSIFSLYGIKG